MGVKEAENATDWLHFHCKKMCLCDEFQNPVSKLDQTRLAVMHKDE